MPHSAKITIKPAQPIAVPRASNGSVARKEGYERLKEMQQDKFTAAYGVPSEYAQTNSAKENNFIPTISQSFHNLRLHYPSLTRIQPKLSKPGDEYEQKVDSIADEIMRIPSQLIIHRKCDDCEKDEQDQLRLKPFPGLKDPVIQAGAAKNSAVSGLLSDKIS